MLRLAGACLLIAGSAGFGWCVWRDMVRRAGQLKLLERAFIMLESEVGYSRSSLPDGLLRVGGRMGGTFGECLHDIAAEVRAEAGSTLKEAWNGRMPDYLKKTCLSEREKALVMAFPEYTGFVDGRMQLTALEQFAGEMGQAEEAARQVAANGKKAVLSISTAVGLLAAILLF